MSDSCVPRRKRLYLSALTTSAMHVRHPLMSVWWAASFAGFGQMILGSHIKGYVLVVMEIIINFEVHLNQAILYSFTGRFDQAKEVLDTRWLLAYVFVYMYGLWDAYCHNVDVNKQAILANREKAPINVFNLLPFSINFLDKRKPWVSIFWNVVFPGLGYMYLLRMVTGFFIIIFWMVCVYHSRFFQALHFTILGDFSQAAAVADPQWFLFLPSIFCFAIYDTYNSAVELNKVFDTEQREYLAGKYQGLELELPVAQEKGVTGMLIAATFDHSSFVELAVTELEERGIAQEKMLAIPLAQKEKGFAILDTIHRADGVSIMDAAAVFGTIGMVLGTIYGFIWTWGPIIWGLIGLFVGAAVGFAGDYLLIRRNLSTQRKSKVSELVLMVSCETTQADIVEQILRNNTAFGVGRVPSPY